MYLARITSAIVNLCLLAQAVAGHHTALNIDGFFVPVARDDGDPDFCPTHTVCHLLFIAISISTWSLGLAKLEVP